MNLSPRSDSNVPAPTFTAYHSERLSKGNHCMDSSPKKYKAATAGLVLPASNL
jgi:hypothetical protein